MTVDADTVASALASTWENLIAAIPDGWVRRQHGLVGGITGVGAPTLNGVWPERVAIRESHVSAMLGEVERSGLPHCLQLRPGTPKPVADHAGARGMVKQPEPVPLMVLENDERLEAAQNVDGLQIRLLASADAVVHARVAARGFDAPEEMFVQLMTPAVLSRPGLRCYVGEVHGEAVTTGVGVTLGPFVGIFNIATLPEHRGRGFGAAVTARAARDGLHDGARWSYLQSSSAGYPVYTRLGYITLERWDCWVTAP